MEDLSLHILDIVENGTQAGATRVEIRIVERRDEDRLVIEIKDNGRGMPPEMAARVRDPFVTTRTTRRVGMGLPLLDQAAREAEGELVVESAPGAGTTVRASFRRSHIDRRPLGDIAETLISLILGHPEVDFLYVADHDGAVTELDTGQLRAELGDTPLSHPEVLRLIRNHLRPAAGA
jgi:hypothetical protein